MSDNDSIDSDALSRDKNKQQGLLQPTNHSAYSSLEEYNRLNQTYYEALETLKQREKSFELNITQFREDRARTERELEAERQRQNNNFINRELEFKDKVDKDEIIFESIKLKNEQIIRNNEEITRTNEEFFKKLNDRQSELTAEKNRYTSESIKQIEAKSKTYVNTALANLKNKENNFHTISKVWSGIGATAILLGIIFLIGITINSLDNFHNATTGWPYFAHITFRGLIVIALFVALARYSFIFSNSYMHESLKNAERSHAIEFGKFYLEVYGASANWDEIKEAFEHWNINNQSAFSKQKSKDIEPTKLMDKVSDLTDIVKESVNLAKSSITKGD